jgi:hypothetical protein
MELPGADLGTNTCLFIFEILILCEYEYYVVKIRYLITFPTNSLLSELLYPNTLFQIPSEQTESGFKCIEYLNILYLLKYPTFEHGSDSETFWL